MRKIVLVISVLVLSLVSCSSSLIKDKNRRDKNKPIKIEKTTSKKITENGKIKGHGYVDLGLPSGRLWATCNVGATKPTEYGEYYAWGETKPKKEYSWANYKYIEDSYKSLKDKIAMSEGVNKYTVPDEKEEWLDCKFIGDRKTILEAIDDAATANWGNEWRMPTLEEQKEMIAGCDWVWTNNLNESGKAGIIGTSKKNGNTVFLPATGFRNGTGLISDGEDYVGCWSSSLEEACSGGAYHLSLLSYEFDWDFNNTSGRCCGLSVRAVVR